MLGRISYRPPPPQLSRRGFLQVSALAGAGFVVGCGSREQPGDGGAGGSAAAPAPEAAGQEAAFNAFVHVSTDDTVSVVVKHLDKGQGITTGLPTIVAEEMDADWSQMRARFAGADTATYKNLFFGIQGTGGSTSVANSWMQLRQAGAAARAMLVAAAARRWEVPEEQITVSRGVLSHSASGRSARFGELAAEAAQIAPPAEPVLKRPEEFTLIGTHVPRLDSPAKTDGSAVFTLDVTRPGMLVAVVSRPPRFGGRVASFDADAARAVAGVRHVVRIPRGVAVVADGYWSAQKGRQALQVDWDLSGAESRGTEQLRAEFAAMTEGPGMAARDDGDVEGALAGAGTLVEASFEFPYLAHATMEPMDCVVELTGEGCEVWTGSQLQTVDQGVVAQITGLPPEAVVVHTHFAGGSFGRRAVPDSDYVAEAAMIAKAIGGAAPVKLIWTREDDMRAGRYRPMSHHRLAAALDGDGNLVGWRHRLAVQSILKGTPFSALVENGIDTTAVEGARTLPYAIPNVRVDLHEAQVGVPVLWWRSVGHTHNGYVTEVFFDQVAAAAGRDPYEWRRELLRGHPRHLAVLETAARHGNWGEALPPGRGRGIAVHESFNSFVAEVAEVTVGDDGSLSVDRVVCAVDCGLAINPDVIRAQMEGGIGYGLSAFLREQISLVDGEVQEGNFDTYRPLRIGEMPAVEVHIVPSAEAPTGVGEPGLPPVGPAVANAIFAASGKRIRRLPLGDQLRA